jgi:hypothetical protein
VESAEWSGPQQQQPPFAVWLAAIRRPRNHVRQRPRYPTFYTFKLLKYFARGGDSIVSASSNHKLLSIYAARRTDGTLALLVINKSPKATLQMDLSMAGFQPQSGGFMYSYGIPQDEAARTGTGSPDIAQTTFTNAAAEFPCSLLPYSVSVLVFRPSPQNNLTGCRNAASEPVSQPLSRKANPTKISAEGHDQVLILLGVWARLYTG